MKKNKTMINLSDRLKKEIAPVVKNNISISEDDLKDIIDFSLINEISENQEINLFLKKQTVKLFNIQVKNIILTGEILTNVFDELAKQGSQEGIYEKWLSINNFNRATAWRYRQRFLIYDKVNEDKKNIIASLSQKVINNLAKLDDIEKVINLVNNSLSKEEIINFAAIETIKEKETLVINEIEEFEIRSFIPVFDNIEEKINLLNEKEKKLLKKHLAEIQKILNK